MSPRSRARSLLINVSDRFRRPTGIADGTRWLFLWLIIVSVILSLSAPISRSHDAVLLLPIAAALTIIASAVYSYLTRTALFIVDVVDAVAILVFALTCPNPAAAYPIVFASVWFRALYGSTRRSLIRAVLYIAAMAASLPLWTYIPGHPSPPLVTDLVVSFPLVLATVIVGRQLGSGLAARERTLQRDGLLAATGSLLLGKTDATEIRQIGFAALTDICAASRGLLLLAVQKDQAILRVQYATDGFVVAPEILAGQVIARTGAGDEYGIADQEPLDAAAGTALRWACVPATTADGWLLVGAPKAVFPEALIAVRSLTNQISLALRTSDTHQELSTRARFDAMTGLANRATFNSELTSALHSRRAEMLHVLFLDLDHFKAVNDLYGHAGGDELLIEVAARLRVCIRPEDLCARLGGDEFGVILRSTSPQDAAAVAQRMVDSIGSPVDLGGQFASVGASIGIAAGVPGTSPEQLVRHADIAMYEAKAKGKGRVQVYGDDLLHLAAG